MSCGHFYNFKVILDGLNCAKRFIDSLDELGRKARLHVLKFLLKLISACLSSVSYSVNTMSNVLCVVSILSNDFETLSHGVK
jgi:hypothetical protein